MMLAWFSVWAVVVVVAAAALSELTTGTNRIETTTSQATVTTVRPMDCADIMMAGYKTSGVYEIYPFTCTCVKPVQVWCDMETDGGGWTVFLSRQNQTEQLDFNRTWDKYKAGFGNPGGEYWLGNEVLHAMTNSREYSIRLDLQLASDSYDFATYGKFKVNSESSRYSTYVTGSLIGSFSAGCLRYINGRSFTTLDRDNDNYNGNCAARQGGGWWYYTCRYANPTTTYNTTMSLTCYSSRREVKQLQFKIRPSICDSPVKTILLQNENCGCEPV